MTWKIGFVPLLDSEFDEDDGDLAVWLSCSHPDKTADDARFAREPAP